MQVKKSFSLRPRARRAPQGAPPPPPAPVKIGTRVVYTGAEYGARVGCEAVLASYGVGESVAHGQSRGYRSPPGVYVLRFDDGWKGLANPGEFTTETEPYDFVCLSCGFEWEEEALVGRPSGPTPIEVDSCHWCDPTKSVPAGAAR